MARLWSCGFELNSLSSNVEISDVIDATPSIQSSIVRSGTYALRINNLSSTVVNAIAYQFSSANSNGALFFRTYFKVTTLPTSENTIIGLFDGPMVYITIDSGGALRLYDEDGPIGSPSSILSTDTWHNIEIQYDRTGGAGSHIVRARINGIEFAGAANKSLSVGVTLLIIGGNVNSESQTQGDWYFDDLAINDSIGSFQNSYPGEGSIIHLRPNAAGDNTTWTAVGSGGVNWDAVDEVTPDDITSYIQPSNLNQIDDYNLAATPVAIGASDTINLVAVGVRFSANNAILNSTFVLRVKAAASGTVEESSGMKSDSTSWFTNAKAVPRNYPLTLYDLPGASTTPWAKADLDTAQIGVRLSILDAIPNYVSTLWLLVEYVTGAPPAGPPGRIPPIIPSDGIIRTGPLTGAGL